MALNQADVKDEITALEKKIAEYQRKLEGLRLYTGKPNGKSVGSGGVSVRSAGDIRPAVKAIFEENGNQPIKVKELVSLVAARAGVEREIAEKKMVYVKRVMLDQAGYGMYRLIVPAGGGGGSL